MNRERASSFLRGIGVHRVHRRGRAGIDAVVDCQAYGIRSGVGEDDRSRVLCRGVIG